MSELTLWDPATGDVRGEVPADTAASVASKLQSARAAQPAWAARSLEERLAVLERFDAQVTRDRDRLAKILTEDTGKPITQARGEVGAVGGRIRYFLSIAEATLAEEVCVGPSSDTANHTEERITQPPLGVIANISAWNYPWFVGANVFVPALIAGNAVLYKPSEHAAMTGVAIAELLWKAGVPREVFALVQGAGTVGAAMIRPGVDGVFFTGSHGTGVRVAQAAAPHLMRVQLELGGKDPLYVADDIDVAWAASAAAEGAFYNTGQSCCAVERIYVHEEIAEAFEAALIDEVGAFRMGDPFDPDTFIGPLCREAQLEVLAGQVLDARKRGGLVACGGGRAERQGWYFEPTVVTNASADMELMREESFGPVIGVQRVASDEQATQLMRQTDYGLTAAVFTRDRERARSLLAQLETGTAYWNCCDRVSPRLPWSGRRGSGLGITLSPAGLLAFCAPRAWHLRPR
ncbi:MAG: aldehyde dehydrogenase family protein [Planctomycetota bacterium]